MKPFTGRKPHIEPWGEYLGHRPIFCFPARDIYEFCLGCWTATPSEPEQIIIFDADYLVPYDSVRWNQLLGTYLSHPEDLHQEEFSTIFADVHAPYGEFVVKEIGNTVFKCELNRLIYGKALRGYDSISRSLIKEEIAAAKDNIKIFKGENPMPFVKKEAFALFLAPAFWAEAMGEQVDYATLAMTSPMAPEPREFDDMQKFRNAALAGGTWASHKAFDRALTCLNTVWSRHYRIAHENFYGTRGTWNSQFIKPYPFE